MILMYMMNDDDDYVDDDYDVDNEEDQDGYDDDDGIFWQAVHRS